VVGDDVSKFIKEMFTNSRDIPAVNHSYLVLLPKVPKLEYFSDSRGSSFDEEQDGQKRYHDHQSGLRESVYMAVSDGTLFEKLLSWQAFQVA